MEEEVVKTVNQKYVISYVLQEIGRDIFSAVSKKFKVGQQVDGTTIQVFSADNALVMTSSLSTVTLTPRVVLSDNKDRCHLIALGMK